LASSNSTATTNITTINNEDTESSLPWSDWCEKDDGSLYPCPDEEVEAGLLPWSNDTSASLNDTDTSISRPVGDDSSETNTTFGGTLEVDVPTPSPQEESSSSSAALETVDETTNTEGTAGLSSGAIFGIILAVVTIPLGIVYLSHRRG